MKTYKAKRKGFVLYLLLGGLIFLFVVFTLERATYSEAPLALLPLILLPALVPVALLTWIYFDTYYQIENGKLKYKSAFLKGTIEISAINKVIVGKTMWTGIKPALAKNGLIIKYNRYDEVYIAPESNSEVIQDLLAVNKNIEVIANS
ncbi:PH domain-containing protein [Pontibacter locisalis]|uniref:PH domain-containing protein n=1 Tax=Pontibacter locisalis TaxID=1719035 RepID=A0ABW5IQF2_9BACT